MLWTPPLGGVAGFLSLDCPSIRNLRMFSSSRRIARPFVSQHRLIAVEVKLLECTRRPRAFPKSIHPYWSDGIGSLFVEQLQRAYEAPVRFLAVRFLVAPPLAAHLAFIRSLRRFRPASDSRPFLVVRFLVAPPVMRKNLVQSLLSQM